MLLVCGCRLENILRVKFSKGVTNMVKKNGSAADRALPMRVRAFQILCALDSTDENLSSPEVQSRLEELFLEEDFSAEDDDLDEASERESLQTNSSGFRESCALAMDVKSRLAEVDALIAEHATGWKIGRMSLVDRTIIRLATYEGILARRVPVAVALSEAVLLAREFGGDESPRFVNGVLARIVRAVQPEEGE